jgi:uncharacterized BrkB/YihY/UPF0761 family membrane protein
MNRAVARKAALSACATIGEVIVMACIAIVISLVVLYLLYLMITLFRSMPTVWAGIATLLGMFIAILWLYIFVVEYRVLKRLHRANPHAYANLSRKQEYEDQAG